MCEKVKAPLYDSYHERQRTTCNWSVPAAATKSQSLQTPVQTAVISLYSSDILTTVSIASWHGRRFMFNIGGGTMSQPPLPSLEEAGIRAPRVLPPEIVWNYTLAYVSFNAFSRVKYWFLQPLNPEIINFHHFNSDGLYFRWTFLFKLTCMNYILQDAILESRRRSHQRIYILCQHNHRKK